MIPIIIAICCNPVFWQHEQIYSLFEKTYDHFKYYLSDDDVLLAIDKKLNQALFGLKDWRVFIEEDICKEILEFNKEKIIIL